VEWQIGSTELNRTAERAPYTPTHGRRVRKGPWVSAALCPPTQPGAVHS
jgi:hypothetical protein